jgi:predicted dehydrogenase
MTGIGIVGLGFGKMGHLPAWRLEPRAQVLGICGGRPENAAGEHGVPYLDWDQMLEREDLQVLSLCVPPAEQPALIVAAAKAGKHLFCEKPLAARPEDALRAVEAAERAGVAHVIDLFFPEIAAWCAARGALSELGELQHAHLSWLIQSRAFRGDEDNWKTNTSKGGGSLANFASHSFHYLEWLFGPVAKLTALNSGGQPPGVQGGAHLLLGFQSGMTASFNVAADAYKGSGHRLEVYGRNGSLVLANNSGDFARGFTLDVATSGTAWRRLVEPQAGEGDGRIPLLTKLAGRLLDSIESGQPVSPGLREGLRVQVLLQAAATSQLEGRSVEVAA